MRALIRLLILPRAARRAIEPTRSIAGASLGIFVTGLLATAFVEHSPANPGLIAPMGAAAVLLFATPSSPLARPWPVLGGSLVSAIAGVAVAQHVANVPSAAALAIGLAMGMMVLFRCLHPPGGAIALAAVVGGPAIHQLGYRFIFWPVLGNALLLLASAVAFNAVTGRIYANPSKLSGGSSAGDEPQGREAGASSEDVDVTKGSDIAMDVNRNVRADNLRGAEFRSDGQRAKREVCEDVTTRDIVAISLDTTLAEALSLSRIRDVEALPVTNSRGTVIGVVMLHDIQDKAGWLDGLAHRLSSSPSWDFAEERQGCSEK